MSYHAACHIVKQKSTIKHNKIQNILLFLKLIHRLESVRCYLAAFLFMRARRGMGEGSDSGGCVVLCVLYMLVP